MNEADEISFEDLYAAREFFMNHVVGSATTERQKDDIAVQRESYGIYCFHNSHLKVKTFEEWLGTR